MIYIGVTGWGDHDIYGPGIAARDKLKEYAAHFPVVELDSSFYAIQPAKNVDKWIGETPQDFKFVVKAYQGMTGHLRGENPFSSKDDMFDAFRMSVQPFLDAGKLPMVLFQFPPWFECTKENVSYLRYCRERMIGLPLALEFRHQSWYAAEYREKTFRFMEKEDWIHTICDEPQAGEGSVPTVLKTTDKDKALIRLHGRNTAAWTGPRAKNWREVRYLYHYNQKELQEWKRNIIDIQKEVKDVYVLFNNNSGGDAAGNAKELIGMLGINYTGLAARQLDLF